jgi:hypothetical protein
MNGIDKRFLDLGIRRYNLLLFNKDNALIIIEQCKIMRLRIFGIDAFHLDSKWIQPFSEFSSDYSNIKSMKTTWEMAKEHIMKVSTYDNDLVYEIDFDTY